MPWPDRYMAEESMLHRWVAEAKAGDAAAFERILRHHERLVLRTAQRMLWNREDSKDAAQEVFLRLYRSLGKFQDERELRPWLYRMTVNLSLDALRKRKSEPVDVELADERLDPEATAAVTQETALIRAALKTLAPKEQAAIVLRDLEGCTTAEVAMILESSEATVRSQISTGRVKIRKFVMASRKERR